MASNDLRQYMSAIPEQDHDGLIDYIFLHIPTGGFLRAVLSNDLKEACMRADEDNRHILYQIVSFLYEHAPADSWGSIAAYEEWTRR